MVCHAKLLVICMLAALQVVPRVQFCPFSVLCSQISHLASALAVTQQALDFYRKLLMNDSRPIGANVTCMSMSDGGALANQK